MKLRILLLPSILVIVFVFVASPWLSKAILSQAAARNQSSLLMSVLVDGEPGEAGWFIGAVRAYVEINAPDAVVTYSVNGGPAVEGREVWLKEPGQYQITWNACKGENCHEPFTQFIKIALMDARPLSFDNGWSFSGKVIEIRDVSLLSMKARVAKVQSRYFSAWVVQHLGEISLADIPIQAGDWVQVSITGTHVSETSVNWARCQSDIPDYCATGSLLDRGLVSLDTEFPLTPSNELINFGQASPHWMDALYWNTSLIVDSQTQQAQLVGQLSDGEFNGNPDGWYRSETVTAHVEVDGSARLFYQLDKEGQQQSLDGLVQVSGDGEHPIMWTLENGQRLTQFIRIDTTAPLVQWQLDPPIDFSGLVDLHGQTSDPGGSGVKETEISFDGGKTWVAHPASTSAMSDEVLEAFSWDFYWDTSRVPDGEYILLARAIDLAGNRSEAIAWTVQVHNP